MQVVTSGGHVILRLSDNFILLNETKQWQNEKKNTCHGNSPLMKFGGGGGGVTIQSIVSVKIWEKKTTKHLPA